MESFMTRSILFVLIGLFIALTLLVVRLTPGKQFANSYPNTVKVGDTQIKLRIAKTPAELEKGLGYIPSLPEKEGMLFVMNKFSYHSFWMKGMEFPLDFIWISGNKIVDITQNVSVSNDPNPAIIRSQKLSNFVLEVNAGFVQRHKVKVGQPIVLRMK